ncbi:MAG TPA: pyruvate, water dikinase [Syntrophobacteraceae bacterium]|nr:pyruvate, water dikinase [Syntrophobacteraceae bacterium]
MVRILEAIKRIVPGRRLAKIEPADLEELRNTFKGRYHNFKLLLNANNKALEIMTEMEQALRGHRPFGMSFIRAACTGVSVNVFRIVKNLDQLAPGRYEELYTRFKAIQDQTNEILALKKVARGERLVIPFREVDKDLADQVGSKMANIGEVRNHLQLPVPAGFVVTSLGYQRFMEHNDLQAEIDRRLQASEGKQLDQLYALSADIQQLIIRAPLPEDLTKAIMDGYREVAAQAGEGVKVSMRSSALGEDSAGTSFAGQYRSELNVSEDNILEAYKEIIASKYTLQAISYRLNRGIRDEDVAMCVGCMAMVNAVSGGVLYTRNPLNIRDDSIFINSVWGLPKSVVDGSVACDLFVASRSDPPDILTRDVKLKDHKFVCYPDEGVCRLDLTGESSPSASLNDDQIRELVGIALRIEEHYGIPQDIEWAVGPEGTIFVLQSRPLQQSDAASRQHPAIARDTNGPQPLVTGGITASSGVACGPVFWVRKNSDALQFPEGSVLVVAQALPRWAALLSRAAAVVTEQGSVAGHLANVAREFGVPAMFNAPGLAENLPQGELVTVDADGLGIYPGRDESLLAVVTTKKNLMEGSPVHDLLKEVTQHVVPLHLLDPDSTEFKPRNCRTFHDITRFCHEKAVKEMFSFGKEHHFSEKASKQLVIDGKVPMQWWFINLDDGFREDVEGKFVPLENIVSIPVLALWEGITAVPWEGPPAMDTRGFMSVLLEAGANPALDPSMPSHYVNRNYFMISKNFCSLNSRFGFHFLTVETLVGERPSENYVSFQFKGGAADYPRRVRRAIFVGGILEEYGFRSEAKEDAVFARMEGYDEAFMKDRLKVLGYLLIHTRQLDMIMANDASMQQTRAKILDDLRTIVDVSPAMNSGEERPRLMH